MAKITIMYMIFKNKLIIYITSAGFIPPHNLNIHHLENWRYISGGKCTAAVDMSGFHIIFVPSKYSFYIT